MTAAAEGCHCRHRRSVCRASHNLDSELGRPGARWRPGSTELQRRRPRLGLPAVAVTVTDRTVTGTGPVRGTVTAHTDHPSNCQTSAKSLVHWHKLHNYTHCRILHKLQFFCILFAFFFFIFLHIFLAYCAYRAYEFCIILHIFAYFFCIFYIFLHIVCTLFCIFCKSGL